MAASIIITAPELPKVEAMLGMLLDRYEDLSPLMDVIGQAMETSTDQRFEDERAPDGSKWTPSIRARESGGKTLTDSARMRQSMTHKAGRDQVETGTNVIYAGTNQGGATIRGKSGPLKFRLPGGLGFRTVEEVIIPKREFLGISADDEDEIEALVTDFTMEGLQ